MAIGSCLLALALATFAIYRSRKAGGFYDSDIYGMTAKTHRGYALAALLLSALLIVSQYLSFVGVQFALEAAVAILVVFYLSSFLRGASEEH